MTKITSHHAYYTADRLYGEDGPLQGERTESELLIERAEICAAGFEAIGREFSADITRTYADALKAGMPAALYGFQISAQEERLAEKLAQGAQHQTPPALLA